MTDSSNIRELPEDQSVAWQYRFREMGNREWSEWLFTGQHFHDAIAADIAAGKRKNYEVRALYTRPALPVGGEAISFRREWIQQICDNLFAMDKLPSGPLGDWAFLFREQLRDKLNELAASPHLASVEAAHGDDTDTRIFSIEV